MPCYYCASPEDCISLRFSRNKKKQTISLCTLCAAERGILQEGAGLHVDLDDLVRALEDDPVVNESSQCPSCGMLRDAIVLTGLCGCSECYHFFKEDLLLLREEGESHPASIGILMKRQQIQSSLQHFERELKHFIEIENYEAAAEIRDRIRGLKKLQDMNHES